MHSEFWDSQRCIDPVSRRRKRKRKRRKKRRRRKIQQKHTVIARSFQKWDTTSPWEKLQPVWQK